MQFFRSSRGRRRSLFLGRSRLVHGVRGKHARTGVMGRSGEVSGFRARATVAAPYLELSGCTYVRESGVVVRVLYCQFVVKIAANADSRRTLLRAPVHEITMNGSADGVVISTQPIGQMPLTRLAVVALAVSASPADAFTPGVHRPAVRRTVAPAVQPVMMVVRHVKDRWRQRTTIEAMHATLPHVRSLSRAASVPQGSLPRHGEARPRHWQEDW